MSLAMKYKPLYVAYLVYFNRDRDYFECHEVLEKLWLAENHDLRYKGLLQIAVALFHVRNHNYKGGLKMFKSALSYLAPYSRDLLGINLGKLQQDVKDYICKLEQMKSQEHIQLQHQLQQPELLSESSLQLQLSSFPYYDLNIEIIDPALAEEVEEASHKIQPVLPLRTTYKHIKKRE